MSARHPETSFSSSATIVPSLYQKPPAPITPPSSSIALPSIHNLPPVHSSSRSSQWPLNQRHYSPSHHQSPAYNFPPIEQHSRISQLQANPSSFGHHQQSAHMLPMLTTATTMNSYSATSHGDHVDLDHRNHHHPHSLSTSIVSTQQMLPQQHPSNLFDRPSSSVSGVSTPPPDFLNPDIGSTSVMYTDDVASQETQYLRRKCSNCGTTKPPSWRHSTLNLGKLVCNKCGLYEQTHNRPRPSQIGSRPANKSDRMIKARRRVLAPAASAIQGPANVTVTSSASTTIAKSYYSHPPFSPTASGSSSDNHPMDSQGSGEESYGRQALRESAYAPYSDVELPQEQNEPTLVRARKEPGKRMTSTVQPHFSWDDRVPAEQSTTSIPDRPNNTSLQMMADGPMSGGLDVRVSGRGSQSTGAASTPAPLSLDSLPSYPPDQKPPFSYPVLIRLAIIGSPQKRLLLSQIYSAIEEKFPWYRDSAPKAWRASVRHCLSLNKEFVRMQMNIEDSGVGCGGWWTVGEGMKGLKRPRLRLPSGPSSSVLPLPLSAMTFRAESQTGPRIDFIPNPFESPERAHSHHKEQLYPTLTEFINNTTHKAPNRPGTSNQPSSSRKVEKQHSRPLAKRRRAKPKDRSSANETQRLDCAQNEVEEDGSGSGSGELSFAESRSSTSSLAGYGSDSNSHRSDASFSARAAYMAQPSSQSSLDRIFASVERSISSRQSHSRSASLSSR